MEWSFYAGVAGGVAAVGAAIFAGLAFKEARRTADAAEGQISLMREQRLPDMRFVGTGYYRRNEQGFWPANTLVEEGYLQAVFRNDGSGVAYPSSARFGWTISAEPPAAPDYPVHFDFPAMKRIEGHSEAAAAIRVLHLTTEQVETVNAGQDYLWLWVKFEFTDSAGGKNEIGDLYRFVPGAEPTHEFFSGPWATRLQEAYTFRRHTPLK